MFIKVEEENNRIDEYLALNTDMSRSRIKKLIKDEKVIVNKRKVKPSSSVHIDDEIEIYEEEIENDIKGENINLDIVYEDDYLLIINKESCMVVHPAPGHYSKTLVNALVGRFSLSNVDNIRPGIVHRIDKDTSGLLVVAKTNKAHELLSDMIKNKKVERKYIALVDGVIPHDSGTIDAPIGRDKKNRQKMMVTDVNGKDAITHFKVLKRYKKHTLIECVLDTGRTHQIRVHMAYINYPIVNDPIYGKSKRTTSFGQMLHSYSIKFIHPITKKEIFFEAELPDEFKMLLNTIASE